MEELASITESVDVLDIVPKTDLSNPDVSDAMVVKLPAFNTLTLDTVPIIPLPMDGAADLRYPQFYEKRCQICTSVYRDLAEHVFISSGKVANSVCNFFARHFGVLLYNESVKTHMEHHCNFSLLAISGLKNYDMRDEELAKYKFNLFETALTALLVELDDIRGMDCKKNNELKLKRAAMVERLTGKLWQLKKERDEAGTLAVDVFSILFNLVNRLPHKDCQQIVLDVVREIRENLKGS